MFSPAMIVANSKINELHAEAAAQRLAKKNRSASRGRFAGALGNIRSFLSQDSLGIPTLTDYPTRS